MAVSPSPLRLTLIGAVVGVTVQLALLPAAPPLTLTGEFHLGQYINRMYLQAQTSVSIISNANIALFTPPGGTAGPAKNIHDSLTSEILTGWQTSQCRDYINQLAGSTRARATVGRAAGEHRYRTRACRGGTARR